MQYLQQVYNSSVRLGPDRNFYRPSEEVCSGIVGALSCTDRGPWIQVGQALIDDGDNSSWTWTFTKTFVNGVLHGDRQPSTSFGACVNRNITETTFGKVDPQKLAKTIPATAVGLAGALMGKVPFNNSLRPGGGGISAFTASAYGLGRALGVGGVAMGGLVGATNGAGRVLAKPPRSRRPPLEVAAAAIGGCTQVRPSIADKEYSMARDNSIRTFFTKRINPIGELLGRILSPWMDRLFRNHPEDYKLVKAYEEKFDNWTKRNLRITAEPTELLLLGCGGTFRCSYFLPGDDTPCDGGHAWDAPPEQ